MVKVNHRFSGETRAPSQGVRGLDVRYSPESFGAGLGKALDSWADAADVWAQKDQKSQRFDSMTNFERFQTNINEQMTELQRETPVNSKNYFERASAIYDGEQEKFLNSVPGPLQQEFEFRANTFRKGVISSALNFSLKQKDLFYTNKLNDTLQKAQLSLNDNPGALEAERKHMLTMIDASDLPEAQKDADRRTMQAALEAITYKSEIRGARAQQLHSSGIVAADLPPQAAGVLGAIAGPESAGHYDIRYDGSPRGAPINSFVDHPRATSPTPDGKKSSAAGKYMFISGTWDQASAGAGVTDFSPASQDKAAWYWAQHVYSRETNGKDLSAAIAAGDFGSIKKALGTEWEGVKNESLADFEKAFDSHAGVYSRFASIEQDPRFSNLSLDQRQSLRADGENEAKQEYNQMMKEQRAWEEQKVNDLYTNLHDGKAGQTDINAARDQGWLRDYDDIHKADTILKGRQQSANDLQSGEAKLVAGGIWSINDGSDKKMANALFGDDGKAALQNRDEGYVQHTLLPRYSKMEMAPPDAANMLRSMANSNNSDNAAFAFETLRQMREQSPEAFHVQFPESIQKQLDFWSLRRNFYQPEELVKDVQNRGLDMAQRQAQTMLRADAKTLSDKFTLTNDVQPLYESYIPWQSADLPITPRGKGLLISDYKALFEDNYVKTGGNADEAKTLAGEALKRVWTLSSIGGVSHIARFPPEVAGYKPHNGGYDWIDRQAREDLGFGPDQKFELIADETTQSEIQKRREAVNKPGADPVDPSYLVQYQDDNGQYHLFTKDGQVQRLSFAPDKQTLAEEEAQFRLKQAAADNDMWQRRYREALQEQMRGGPKVSPALEQRANEALAEQLKSGQAIADDWLQGDRKPILPPPDVNIFSDAKAGADWAMKQAGKIIDHFKSQTVHKGGRLK